MKMEDHTPLTQALAAIYEAPWDNSFERNSNNGDQNARQVHRWLSGWRSNDSSSETIDGENRCDASFCKNVELGWLSATCIFLGNA